VTSRLQTVQGQTQSEPESSDHFLVCFGRQHFDEAKLEKVSAAVGVAPSELSTALKVARVVPLVAAATLQNAEATLNELKSFGVDSLIISEQELALDSPAHETRALEFRDDALAIVGPHGRGRIDAAWNSVRLIVIGRLHFATVEVEQKPKKSQSKLFEERQLSRDEAVLDIYLGNENIAWRVMSNSFDYSCLGEEKDVTAFKNFATLIQSLRKRAADAEFNDDYVRLRAILDKIWPIENSEQPRERRRSGWRELEASVTHASNEAQFERYSRVLRWVVEET
jgi:hypothetical protein